MTASHTFGRYEIKAELGRGGMATVYRATDPFFGRDVALKVLPREFLHDTTFRARFEREARTIAALEHPAIVPVHDFGEQDGQPFLVMRYMPGGSLAERIAEGPITPEETARIIGQLAPALDAAHEHGVIHRDLKPANVLFDQKDNAYLSDFGIAKVAQATTALTGTGIIGTPAYMSPEQGHGQPVDWRSDLYSLGVIIFQMLSGRLPYQADTPVGMIYSHIHDPIPDVVEANPALPTACADLIGRAMAKNPAGRYQSAGEMADDLKAALTPQPSGFAGLERPLPATSGRYEERGRGATGAPPSAPPYAPTVDVVEPPARPTPHTEKKPSTPRPAPHRGTPTWMWVVRIAGGIAVLVCGVVFLLILLGPAIQNLMPVTSEPGERIVATQKPVSTETATPLPTRTLAPTETPIPLGFAGNPVTANNQWTPVIQAFDGVEMVLVPAGCLIMGSDDGYDDERPVHKVCFDDPFWIDRTEVTNGQYGSSGFFSGDNRPRESINWFNARAFCESRGARLPTEAEWEYAARGSDGLVYPWGNEFIADNVVYEGNSGGQTADVGSKPGGVSWVGALDMSGNVWEWVDDWYSDTYYGTLPDGAVNPQGPGSGTSRGLRGGSWGNYGAGDLRAAYRGRVVPSIRYNYYGFRCARSY